MPEEILQPLIDGAAQGDQAALVDQQIDVLQKITDYDIKEWPIEVLVEKFTNGKGFVAQSQSAELVASRHE